MTTLRIELEDLVAVIASRDDRALCLRARNALRALIEHHAGND